jgi:hypothetical protein
MKTKYRLVNLKQYPQHSTSSFTQATEYRCGGAVVNNTIGTQVYPAVDISFTEERMNEYPYSGKSNGVKHRSTEYWAATELIQNVRKPVPNAALGTDRVIDTIDSGPIDLKHHEVRYYINKIGKDALAFDTSQLMTGNPKWWAFSSPVINDNIVINDLFEQSKGLKADVLLNITEANQLWPSLKGIAFKMQPLSKGWKELRKHLRYYSSNYLAWKFGISPLISDLQSCIKAAPQMAQQYERWKRQDLSRFSRSFECVASFNPVNDVRYSNGALVWNNLYKGTILNKPLIRYVLVTKPNVKYQTDAFNKLSVLINKFSSSPSEFAWEKVPFSFVADWFVDLRGPLREIDNLVGHKPYEVVSLTKSFGYYVQTSGGIEWRSPCSGNAVLISANACNIRYKHYERSNLKPRVLFPEWKVRFGKSQAGVTSALIAQKLSSIRY